LWWKSELRSISCGGAVSIVAKVSYPGVGDVFEPDDLAADHRLCLTGRGEVPEGIQHGFIGVSARK